MTYYYVSSGTLNVTKLKFYIACVWPTVRCIDLRVGTWQPPGAVLHVLNEPSDFLTITGL